MRVQRRDVTTFYRVVLSVVKVDGDKESEIDAVRLPAFSSERGARRHMEQLDALSDAVRFSQDSRVRRGQRERRAGKEQQS